MAPFSGDGSGKPEIGTPPSRNHHRQHTWCHGDKGAAMVMTDISIIVRKMRECSSSLAMTPSAQGRIALAENLQVVLIEK